MRDISSPLDGILSPFGVTRGPSGPSNTVAPVISGTATVGETLSSTTGTWSGEGTITYAYQWLDDGAAISGATSSTYTLTAGEEGGNITCRVTATDDNGSTAATSNSLGPVAAATGAPLSLSFDTDTYTDGTNTAFGDIFTFARSGSATYVDSGGVIQTAATGVARRNHHEYNGTSWVNKGLLLETDSATNFIEYSSNLTGGTFWLSSGGARASGVSITNPTNSTVSTFTVSSPANNIRLYTQSRRTPSTVSTFSFLAKSKGGISWVKSRIDIAGSFDGAYFDLSTGSVGTEDAGVTARIENFGGGWYLCSTTVNAAADQYAGLSLAASDGDVDLSGYGGSTEDGVYLTAMQWEDDDYRSSYIPTSGSTVTRAGEALAVEAASVPWSTTALSFVFKGEANNLSGVRQPMLLGRRVSGDNSIAFFNESDDTVRALNENSNVSELAVGGAIAAGYRVSISAGMRVTTTDLQAVVAGTAGTNETANNGIFDYSAGGNPLFLGRALATYSYNGTIASVEMWDSDIGAAQLETETA